MNLASKHTIILAPMYLIAFTPSKGVNTNRKIFEWLLHSEQDFAQVFKSQLVYGFDHNENKSNLYDLIDSANSERMQNTH